MRIQNVKDGDTLVVLHPNVLSVKGRKNLKSALKEAFGNKKLVILEEGMELEILRKE